MMKSKIDKYMLAQRIDGCFWPRENWVKVNHAHHSLIRVRHFMRARSHNDVYIQAAASEIQRYHLNRERNLYR